MYVLWPEDGPLSRPKHVVSMYKKTVPLEAWTDPEGSSKLRFPDFVTAQGW